MATKHHRFLGLITLALGLLAFACAPAEEPTATPTSAPEVATPTATTAPVVAGPTATSPAVAARPTATPMPRIIRRPEEAVVGAQAVITPELIDSLPQMTVKEVMATFPAQRSVTWEYEDIKRGGIFRLALTSDISTFDHRKATAGGTTNFTNVVYERLVEYEQGPMRNPYNPAIGPALAHSWEYNADGTQLTFHLVEGVHWGDLDDPFQLGPEVVAEDFVFTINEYRSGGAHASQYRSVESVEAPDRYTVVINFSSPSFYVLPFLASKDAVMMNPHIIRAGRADSEMVGPGPFILVEAKKSIGLKFVRNPNYFMKDERGNPLPYVDGILDLIVPDVSTRVALVRTRKVEYGASVADTIREMQPLLRTNPDLQVTTVSGTGNRAQAYNNQSPLFQDINVRRAITLAINGKGIGDIIWGLHSMPDNYIEWFYWRDEQPTWEDDLEALYGPWQHHYDLERAKELWAKTGLGEIELEYDLFLYRQYHADRAAIIASDLEKLGVHLKIHSLDYTTYNSRLLQGTFKDIINAWLASAYDVVAVAIARTRSDSILNRPKFQDQIIDDLVDELVYAGTQEEQRAIVQKIRARYGDQVYWATSAAPAFGIDPVLQPWVRNVGAGRYQGLSFYEHGKVGRRVWLDL